jgi:hypothetical protein
MFEKYHSLRVIPFVRMQGYKTANMLLEAITAVRWPLLYSNTDPASPHRIVHSLGR